MNRFTLIAGAILGSGLAALAQVSVSIDFDTAGQLSNSFNIYQNAAPGLGSPYVQSPSGGIGNSGAVTVLAPGTNVTADSTAIYRSQSFDFPKSGQLTVSELVNVIPNSAGGNRLVQLGFVNESTSGMNNNAGVAFVSLRLSTVGSSGNIYSPAYQDKTAAGNVVNTVLAPNVTLKPGNWYRLSGWFINQGGGQFTAGGTLDDMGPAGTGRPLSVFTFPPQQFFNPDITRDSTVWPAFRAFHNDGANALDDFVFLPEPGTLALWVAGLLGLGCRACLRRQG